METEKALSEIVGALLLVALVITGIGIVGIVMFSTPPPETKEKAVLSSSCMQCSENAFIILTRHEGGDVLNPQNMKFFLSTEFANHTFMSRFPVKATYFIPAEIYSSWDKAQLCAADDKKVIHKEDYKYSPNVKTMKNGDVIVIWYEMDEDSTI